jgi:hypothetical protein
MQLAFSPDGRSLIAESLTGQWVMWPVAAENRSTQQLRNAADLLNPETEPHRLLRVASAAERQDLRRQDPGAGPPLDSRPRLELVRGLNLGHLETLIPRRDPSAGPMALDLTAFYDISPVLFRKFEDSILPSLRGVPIGLVRLDGVDYDLRGSISLERSVDRIAGFQGQTGFASTVSIPAPATPVTAFHLLLYAPLAVPESHVRLYMTVRLHYQDGSQVALPVFTQRDVPGGTDHDASTPVGWVNGDRQILIGERRQIVFSAVRLPNPHPERIVVSLNLEGSTELFNEPIVLAITAEPAAKAAQPGMTSPSQPPGTR